MRLQSLPLASRALVVPRRTINPAADAYPFMSWLKPLSYRTAYEPGLPASLLTELGRVKEMQQRRTPALDAQTMTFAPLGSWVLWEQYAKELSRELPPDRALAARTYVKDVAKGCLAGCLQVKKQNPEPRPFQVDPSIQFLGHYESTSSHTSGHAAIAYASATALSALFPQREAMLMSTAQNVARSRVYMGVHFPGDVGSGARFGRAFALQYLAENPMP